MAVVLRFRSRAARTIQFEMGDPMPAFGGVVVPRGERVWRPRMRYGPKVIVLGDSRAGGLGAVASFTGLVQRVALRLGWLNVWASGTDGTGYTTSPSSGRLAFAARLQHDVIDQHPDAVVVTGGNNDDDPAAVQPAAAELFRRIRAGLPRAKLVVVTTSPATRRMP